MSKPRDNWWGYVKSMIRLYPGRIEELRAMQEARTTPGYGGAPGGSAARVTEELATASLGRRIDREVEAVRRAIEETERMPDGEIRLEFIGLVYWRRSHNIHGASEKCYISYRTGRRWHEDFVRRVAEHFF